MWQMRYTKGLVPRMIEAEAVDLGGATPPNDSRYFTKALDMPSELAWECWLKVIQGPTYPYVAGLIDWGSGYLYINPGATPSDPVRLSGWVHGSVEDADSLSTVDIPVKTWVHVAMTFSNTGDKKVHLFINGVESTYSIQLAASGTISSGNLVTIGATGSLAHLTAVLGTMRISSRVRAVAEFAANYKNGIPAVVENGDQLVLGTVYPWNKDLVSGTELTVYGVPPFTREVMKAAG